MTALKNNLQYARMHDHTRDCIFCGRKLVKSPMYMVTQPIWDTARRRAGAEFDGLAHLGCVFKEIGREPGVHDFRDVPLNDWLLKEPEDEVPLQDGFTLYRFKSSEKDGIDRFTVTTEELGDVGQFHPNCVEIGKGILFSGNCTLSFSDEIFRKITIAIWAKDASEAQELLIKELRKVI